MKPNWKSAPEWCTHWLELEGNRELWADKEYTKGIDIAWAEPLQLLSVPDVEDSKNFFSLRVLQCISRPEWKTLIHFKDNGKLVTYEAEGHLSHAAVKRQLLSELGVDKNFRFMLEYVKLN